MKHFAMILIVAMAFGAAGCEKEAGQAGGGMQRPPTPVEAALVVNGAVTDHFTTIGTIEADQAITVTSEINGILTAVPFAEGQRLAAGELIAQLDDRQLRAEAERARALKDQRHSAWERVRSVVAQGGGAPQDLDDAVAALKVAEADLALAETRLAKTHITAPFNGLAGIRRVSRGTFLRAGDTITDLAKIDKLRVAFAVPERILGSLRAGSEVTVVTTAYPDQSLTGTIAVIEPQLDAQTRAADVVALVDNPEELLRPGMSATVTVVMRQRASALTVPSAAVFVAGGQTYVYVIKADSLVTRTPVSLGTRLADVVEITEGLSDGQQVVRAGHQKLYEGAKVAPVGSEGDAASGAAR